MKRRFVILEHTIGPAFSRGPGAVSAGNPGSPVHWDWLFEPAQPQGLLCTWATQPLNHADLQRANLGRFILPEGAFAACRLKDHRRAYLEFEGDIGRGRGRVRPIAKGTFCPTIESQTELAARLNFDALDFGPGESASPSLWTGWRIRFAYSDKSNPSPDAITLWISSPDSSVSSSSSEAM